MTGVFEKSFGVVCLNCDGIGCDDCAKDPKGADVDTWAKRAKTTALERAEWMARAKKAESALLNVHDALHAECDGSADLAAEVRALRARAEKAEAELATLKERRFPVMTDYGAGFSIPWSVVAPFGRQAELNHGGQTLERLAERGGLSPRELWHVMHGRSWSRMNPHPDCPGKADCHAWALGLAKGQTP